VRQPDADADGNGDTTLDEHHTRPYGTATTIDHAIHAIGEDANDERPRELPHR
jgi:hypothetical protein